MCPDSTPLAALRFDAGSLSLNLVATRARRFGAPVERLTSVGRLAEWLGHHGLEAPASQDALQRARDLRERLDALFRGALSGGVSSEAVDALNAGAFRPQLRQTPDGLAVDGGFDGVVGLIVADAMRIVTTSELRDLRTCEAHDCRMLYLHRGGRARRWCSSERCGNRSRVAAHRARDRGTA
jgi:predicted RNA-binding Zn ribbon-like protein